MQLPTTFDDLIEKATNYDLYVKLVEQLNKDFLLANIDLEFDNDLLPVDLKRILHHAVFKLIQENFADYLNLLYIVDVSENKVKQIDGSDISILSEHITFLILQREWQKVWFKNQY